MLKAVSLAAAHDGDLHFSGLDLTVGPGDRIGVVGPNGAGKTTLRDVAVLPQTCDGLRTDVTVMQHFRHHVPVYADDAEHLLTAHQFGPDTWHTTLLAVMVNGPARSLLLDEATNYLDFDALDVIEEALHAFHGTLITVTHDRFFADAVGHTRRWHLTGGRVAEH